MMAATHSPADITVGNDAIGVRVTGGLRGLHPEAALSGQYGLRGHGDAIHGHPVERGLIAFGIDVFAQYSAGSLTDR